tara:strand:- start:1516 stop:1710 length:195 start_codon:yes stop_codon:yes gene_type:complete
MTLDDTVYCYDYVREGKGVYQTSEMSMLEFMGRFNEGEFSGNPDFMVFPTDMHRHEYIKQEWGI